MDSANFQLEDVLEGRVCGIDEVGRGPLAGPVVAACVYIPGSARNMPFITNVKDSKKLSWKKLEALYKEITEHCVYGTASVPPAEIDEINILQASLRAMEDAFASMCHSEGSQRLKNLDPSAQALQDGNRGWPALINGNRGWHALIDGNKLPINLPCPASAIVKGDSKSKSIAAASIVAKYTRDTIMHKLAEEHPHYGWESNVGYPSKAHLSGIDAHGITEHHRKSYAPVRNFILRNSKGIKP